MGLAWEEQLSVGNAMIDSEHKNLIIVVNSVEHAIRTRDSFALSRAFKLLEDCMRIHFTNEEKIAQAVNFPFTNNKLEHYYILKGTSINRIFIAPVVPYSDFSPEFLSQLFLSLKLADFKPPIRAIAAAFRSSFATAGAPILSSSHHA